VLLKLLKLLKMRDESSTASKPWANPGALGASAEGKEVDQNGCARVILKGALYILK
jgi:hypothetical protein